MEARKLSELILEKGKNSNIDEMEIYQVSNSSMAFSIYKGNLEGYNIAEENALSLSGIFNGKMGYSYTERLSEDSIDELIGNVIQYAENNESKDVESFCHIDGQEEGQTDAQTDGKVDGQTGGQADKQVNGQAQKSESKWSNLSKYTEEDKIEYMKSIEKAALALDSRISIVEGCSYEENKKSITIRNQNSAGLETTHGIAVIELSVVAKAGDDVQTGYDCMIINDLSAENKSKIVKNAVYDAVNMLGAQVIASGNFDVILRNNVAAEIFSYMSPVFLGSMVQKKLSMLKGKLGQKVAADLLNIVDNPLLENGKIYRAFDDEGVSTYSKYIIQNGELKTFLHNTNTAKKAGLESTGSGFRVSYKSSIDVMVSNMYIEEGKTSFEEMLKSTLKGILITEVQGLHAGINTISGDFSLSCSGYLINNGQIDKPVNQITISGNYYEMLQDITMIGNDTKFCAPYMNYFGAPSLKVKNLTVAGK
jgi:PmbA protein